MRVRTRGRLVGENGRVAWGFLRLAAPAVFLLAVTIAALLVRAGLRADEEERPAPVPVQRTTTETDATTTIEPTTTPRIRTYTVQPGDTFDSIALELDTTVEELVQLNPGVDPTGLTIGQRLRVPPPPG